MVADPRPALREAVAGLLVASGRDDLSALVAGAEIELCAGAEIWSIGAREVAAQRLALLVTPAIYARLQGTADLQGIRDAFATVVRSFDTELAEFALFVSLPSLQGGWGHAYRSAPVSDRPEPAPDAVRSAAIALAEAYGREEDARALERSSLEVGVTGDPDGSLRKWVVRLEPDDFVALDRSLERSSFLERVLRIAAAGATVQVGEVVLSCRAP